MSKNAKPIRRILVSLDLTNADEKLIQYASFLSDLLHQEVEEVYFVHNITLDPLLEEELRQQPLKKPLEKIVEEGLRRRIGLNYTPKTPYQVVICRESTAAKAIQEISSEKDISLVIVGKKNQRGGSGHFSDKLIRMQDLKADLLMVPETAYPAAQEILVPTDFSESSAAAFRVGRKIREAGEGTLRPLNAVRIPPHYFPYIPVESLSKKLKKESEESWQKFARKLDTQLSCDFEVSQGESVSETIYRYAIRQNAQLIIVGARGKSPLGRFLVGSVSARLMHTDMHLPLWVVR